MSSDPDYFIGVAQQAMWITALAIAPILIPALLIGLFIGMIQAATSLNEQILSFLPKLVVIALVLALFGGSIFGLIVDFMHETYGRIPDLVR
ncbi:flagellar biosynthesis protein FliQ [Zymomonas mobilis subsp. mobilis ZM4 = ATCC 31821]|uniref:Export protein FliQ family 3 n=2 Tax=Zymomonas mobilis subsp. mobilis TaxID=120045 RepID=Q3V8G2_ZYMMO|nr:flagellar biosynthetic protein FliQ [Zymomonas mobilis]AAV89272.1 export protein FliQ family 3 [Zymomonas mobilis subsp. mobilis ZM4 = ATCC 31821]ACV75166.1 export protein FliQ family 3 [Zymomonas mobilis subsp. mobilis NCIMB 11163]AEH62994.1 export protein FliQ family 3 [Zymomonas mobilis subsp. mobilis ATCC 10988]AHB09954.1 flagellar biosynthesis pathway, component FliQ [Zymomonas mobilis subsp. mobilis str. CP4 = NRRL B-14023]AHJ70259.1 Flagellar biosynthetic protein FliQ [Zymomonas mobi